MRDVIKVHVFRCVGKTNGVIVCRINVVAGNNRHAERTCALWLSKSNLASLKVQWQVKAVKIDNPIYLEWEDGA